MQYLVVGLIFFVALFLQSSITAMPLILVALLLAYIVYRHEWVFLSAFFSGLIIDVVLVRSVGVSSLFLLSFLFVIFLYQRKFEIGSYYFIFFALFIGTLSYVFFFGRYYWLPMAVMTALVGVGSFWLLQKIVRLQKKSSTFL